MSKPEPGTRKMFDRRMRSAKNKRVKKEFREWIVDMGYESLLGSPTMKACMFEAFVGGWGAKLREVKRNAKAKANANL